MAWGPSWQHKSRRRNGEQNNCPLTQLFYQEIAENKIVIFADFLRVACCENRPRAQWAPGRIGRIGADSNLRNLRNLRTALCAHFVSDFHSLSVLERAGGLS
jgi:hypothetical protein